MYTILFALLWLASSCIAENIPTFAPMTKEGKFIAPLAKLFELTGINHENTLLLAIQETQQKWLRQAGKERWQLNDTHLHADTTALNEQFDALGLQTDLQPHATRYTYALILGATVKTMALRLCYLQELIQNGLKIEKVIVLTGERPLDATIENKQEIENALLKLRCKKTFKLPSSLPTTEYEAASLLIDALELAKNYGYQTEIIISPMIKLPNGSFKNPTTADTIKAWLDCKPAVGTILAFSSNPHIRYQHSVLTTYIPDTYQIETIGPRPDSSLALAVYLDALARWLYQEGCRTGVII